jgi:hypothetical protein
MFSLNYREEIVVVVTLYICSCEVLVSNLGRDNGYPDVFLFTSFSLASLSSALNTEIARSSETLVTIYQVTRRHTQKDNNHHTYRRENLQSRWPELRIGAQCHAGQEDD